MYLYVIMYDMYAMYFINCFLLIPKQFIALYGKKLFLWPISLYLHILYNYIRKTGEYFTE